MKYTRYLIIQCRDLEVYLAVALTLDEIRAMDLVMAVVREGPSGRGGADEESAEPGPGEASIDQAGPEQSISLAG